MKWQHISGLSAVLGLVALHCSDNSPPGNTPPPPNQMMMPNNNPDMTDPSMGQSPALVAVMPSLGPTAGGIPVKLGGQGFAAGARVLFAGVEASGVKVVSETQIDLTLPTKFGAWGKVPVDVVLPDG